MPDPRAVPQVWTDADGQDEFPPDVLASLLTDAEQVIARYPDKRSALLPLLHLVQSSDGYVSARGVRWCADLLDLTTAEVSGVATFYTQYKRHPNGEYTVGVCINTLCAVMGGDQIWDTLSDQLGIGHDETTADGKITLERVECNAACDYAPVVMVNWEFFDNQTPQSATELVDALRTGTPVRPTRGPSRVCSFKAISRVLAGFEDGLADEGVGAGPATLQGLRLARERGWTAPRTAAQARGEASPEVTADQSGGGLAPGRHESQDGSANAPGEHPANTEPTHPDAHPHADAGTGAGQVGPGSDAKATP